MIHKPLRFQWQKVILDLSFSGPGFCSISPQSISNSSINCLVKIFSQTEWLLMRGPFIHFVMTNHEISKFIFSSTHIKKNKIKKNLILILLYKKAIFWTVKFKLSFWKLFDCVTILVDWKTPILAYQVLLSIGIIDSNSSNNKTKAP